MTNPTSTFRLRSLHRDLRSEELTTLMGTPIVCFDAGDFPHPWQVGSRPTEEACKANRDWMHQALQQDVDANRLPWIFSRFDKTMLMHLTGQKSYSPVYGSTGYKDTLLQSMPSLSGPATLLNLKRTAATQRLSGTHRSAAGVIVMPPADWSPRQIFACLTHCPEDLLERCPKRWVTPMRRLFQLHEAAHIVQGTTIPSALPLDRKDWPSVATTEHHTPLESEFLRELDADLLSQHMAKRLGMSDKMRRLGQSVRLLGAFVSGEKRYWFGPHFLGYHPDYAACLDAQREINISSLYMAMGQPAPDGALVQRWTSALRTHKSPETMPEDVQQFIARSNQLDAALAEQPHELALLFTALGKLSRQHHFTTPMVQALATATADSAALFMPKLMGYHLG